MQNIPPSPPLDSSTPLSPTGIDTSTDVAPDVHKTASNIALLAAIVIFIVLALRFFNYTEDDVFIPMRYALNLWRGHGWVMNSGERVNGCTSPAQLWYLTLLLRFVSPNVAVVISKFLGIAGGVYVLISTRRLLKIVFPGQPFIADFAPLIVAIQMSFVLSMIDGMETAAATVLLITALTRFAEEASDNHNRSAIFFALASLCRPELTVVFPVLWVVDRVVSFAGRRSRLVFADVVPLLIFLVPMIGLGLFNYLYYGDALPNTYYAKNRPFPTGVGPGLEYMGKFALVGPWPVLILGLAVAIYRDGKRTLILLIPVLLEALFLLKLGGDWMMDGRFYATMAPYLAPLWLMPFALIPAVREYLNRRASAPVVNIGIGFSAVALGLMIAGGPVHKIMLFTQFRHLNSVITVLRAGDLCTRWRTSNADGLTRMSRWVQGNVPRGQTVMTSEIGLLGLENMDDKIVDIYGLTDHFIARLPGYKRTAGGVYCVQDWMKPGPLNQYLLNRQVDWVVLSKNDQERIVNQPLKQYGGFAMVTAFPMKADYGDFTVTVWRRTAK